MRKPKMYNMPLKRQDWGQSHMNVLLCLYLKCVYHMALVSASNNNKERAKKEGIHIVVSLARAPKHLRITVCICVFDDVFMYRCDHC